MVTKDVARFLFRSPIRTAAFLVFLLSSHIVVNAVPGNLDWTFGTGGKVSVHVYGSDSARDLAIQPDGKIVVAGVGSFEFNIDFTLIRLNPDGTLDTSFGTGGRVQTPFNNFNSRDDAWAMALQTDGKIIVVGTFTGPQQREIAAARYNSDGSLDSSFDGDGKLTIPYPFLTFINDVKVQTDGKIVLCGDVAFAGIIAVRLNSNGSLDTSFDNDGIVVTTPAASTDAQAFSLALQADGKIILAGMARGGAAGTGHDFALVRFNTDGSLDTSFDGDGKVTTPIGSGEAQEAIFSLVLQQDGKIIAAGYTSPFFAACVVARYDTGGSLDTSFGTGGVTVTAVDFGDCINASVDLQIDGRIVVSGQTGSIGTFTDYSVGRYTASGFPDRSFGVGGTFAVPFIIGEDRSVAVKLQTDGKIVATGIGTGDFIVTRHVNSGARVADFDGDIKTDVSIFRPSVGEWWYRRSSDGQVPAFQFGSSTDKIVPADFTGDGKTDVAIFRPSVGEWFVLRSENGSFYSFPFGTDGDIPVPADYDNDGKADAAIFRPSTATWFISKSTGGTHIEQFGATGDVPVPSDYDGDGRADVAIFRPSNGQWWLNRTTAGVIALAFGASTDKQVQGDYTGDGKADVAFWRPSTGEWFVLRSEDFSYYSAPFGAATDIPAAGDYDGDGKMDTTVFRPSTATWFSQRSTAGTLIQQFGATGDTPIPSAFVP